MLISLAPSRKVKASERQRERERGGIEKEGEGEREIERRRRRERERERERERGGNFAKKMDGRTDHGAGRIGRFEQHGKAERGYADARARTKYEEANAGEYILIAQPRFQSVCDAEGGLRSDHLKCEGDSSSYALQFYLFCSHYIIICRCRKFRSSSPSLLLWHMWHPL